MQLTLLLVIVAVALGQAAKEVPAFAETLNNLQRSPPVPPIKTRSIIQTNWIEQKLDHFDDNETKTWQMRYMTNDEHFQAGGPMFIFVGGEWSIESGNIGGGHFYDMAQEHNGMLYYTEHRYYGQSKPTSDINWANLKYLHAKQALGDLAHFIRHKRETEPALANSKVIMAGGSYAGTLVVWFKRLYPELLAGGWASSAPLLAKVDFREYKEVVGQVILQLGSQQCYNRIERAMTELERMFANKRGAEVKAMMKICDYSFNDNNDLDLWSLFGTISNIFAGIVQYQKEGDIPQYCDYLMSFDDDVTAIASLVLLAFDNPKCVSMSYQETLAYYKDNSYANGAGRPWYYQTCNEFGWYQSSSSSNQPFGSKFPVTLYTTLCADIFGAEEFTNENINLKANQTNIYFGGMKPEVENVYMTQGALDPWYPVGHGTEQGATVIPRASYCADFGSISSEDSKEMRATKERIAELVRDWLADSPTDIAHQFLQKLEDWIAFYLSKIKTSEDVIE